MANKKPRDAGTVRSAGRTRGLRAHGLAARATQGRHRPRGCRDPSQRHGRSDGGVVGLRCPAATPPLADTTLGTWGLQATRGLSSRYTGRGIRVARLDTGLDLQHPDFAGRTIVSQSFVTGLPVDDDNGHGTFCAGVACGPQQPPQRPRYGIAFGADLYIARVLDDHADGTDGNVLAGIDWAVRNNCAVISISLGSPVALGDSYPHLYEQVAARALAAGSLLIAPAGNESQRPDTIAPDRIAHYGVRRAPRARRLNGKISAVPGVSASGSMRST